jgi:ABC-type Fe3+-hydroxamate transport system substrate-binding protein
MLRRPATLLLAAILSSSTTDCYRPRAVVVGGRCSEPPPVMAAPAVVTVAPGQIAGVVEVPRATRAVVYLEPTETRTITDSVGRFLFADLPPGRYVLVSYAHMSDPHRDTVLLAPNAGVAVYVRLRRPAVCLMSRA